MFFLRKLKKCVKTLYNWDALVYSVPVVEKNETNQMENTMVKARPIRPEFHNAEIVANWMIRYNDPEKGKKKLEEAERLCVLNGMQPGEFSKIINGDFKDYTFSQLLEINKIINKKKRTK